MNNKAKSRLIVFGIIFLLAWYVGSLLMNEKLKKEHNIFKQTEIKGRIESTEYAFHEIAFKLKNNNNRFVFSPKVDRKLNGDNLFIQLAEPGDSVFKKVNGDTLYLIKSDGIYKYTFRRN